MTAPTKEQIKAAADRAEARARGKSTPAEELVATALSEAELDAEIAKLAALPIGVYESSRVLEARRLSLRASVLDFLVSEKRSKKTREQTDFLPHWHVEPWPETVAGAVLLEELRKHFTRYVVLPKYADAALALWTLLTWVFDCFDITPYLAITSPTRRCGKTLLMTMLYWLCCRAKKNDTISKAAIYRTIEADRPTLLLDEVGWVVDLKDERQGILCGGFERLGYVEVCEGESANITTKRYSTYSPKAFGLIGKLTPTLMDRSIEIRMQRKTKTDKVERLRRRDNAEHQEFRRRLQRWANDNRSSLGSITPKELAGLNDRAFDAWESLLAIAEQVGGDWPKLTREAAIALSGGEIASEERGVELLAEINAAFEASAKAAITTKSLISLLCVDEEKPWANYDKGKPITDRQLAKLLKPFTIISETVHPHETGEVRARGYKRERFEDAFSRYLSSANGSQNDASFQFEDAQACKRADSYEVGTTGTSCKRTEDDMRAHEKSEKSASHAGLHACTDKKPQNGDEERFDQRAGAVNCAHCRRPGGFECSYDGLVLALHRECVQPWVTAYEASASPAPMSKSNHTNGSNADGTCEFPTDRANPLKSNGRAAADSEDANFPPQSTPEKSSEGGWRERL
jgi:Protein of unknown function (DUF3631)